MKQEYTLKRQTMQQFIAEITQGKAEKIPEVADKLKSKGKWESLGNSTEVYNPDRVNYL